MGSGAAEYLAKILEVPPDLLRRLDTSMVMRVERKGVLDKVANESEIIISRTLDAIGIHDRNNIEAIREALRGVVFSDEKQLFKYMESYAGQNSFEKAVALAKNIARAGKGFFLKKECGAQALRMFPPERMLVFFGYKTVDELLARHDIEEIFSALRFMESDEWMHTLFEKAYSGFTMDHFEERPIEVRVLGAEWKEVGEKFAAKKHHNVSHLKEFGVIFLNPIAEDVPGKFIRDFDLLLHYFHEIEFYSKLFQRYAGTLGFTASFKSLLRGDVRNTMHVGEGEWLIVQRYLWKIDPEDPRLFLPRVNPESMHWFRGERDIVELGEAKRDMKLALWHNLDWVGLVADNGQIVSFDLEDNAMSEVASAEGRREILNYHQREALWTRIFQEYAGGEFEMERLLVENFEKGSITFPKR